MTSGYGKFHCVLLALCGWALSSDAIEVLAISFILPPATCDLHMSNSDKGLLNSSVFLGMFLFLCAFFQSNSEGAEPTLVQRDGQTVQKQSLCRYDGGWVPVGYTRRPVREALCAVVVTHCERTRRSLVQLRAVLPVVRPAQVPQRIRVSFLRRGLLHNRKKFLARLLLRRCV